jgi:hypothetical protein
LVIISIFVLGKVLGQVLGEILELISGFIVKEQVVHPEEGLLLGVVSIPCHEDIIISFLESKVIAK